LGHPPGTAAVFPNSVFMRELLLLLAITGCLFFIGLGRLPLLEPDEGRNAEVAREMLADGSWITPHFNTLPYLDKPAIFFWMVAGSMRLFGLSEQAARLPSALMALGTALLSWLLARRMFPEVSAQTGGSGDRSSGGRNALLAAIVWATCPLVIAFAREVILDMTLTFLLTAALVSFWFASSQSPGGAGLRRLWANVILFGSMGLATFVKGPVGFVLPLLVIVVYQWSRGRIAELGQLRWGLGGVVFLLITAPWFIAVSIRNPAFPRYALWDETLVRFTTGHLHRPGGPFYYVPVFLGGFFPWSFCLLFAAWNRLKNWRVLTQEDYKAELFLLVWMTVVLVFFTISRSKLPGYILPVSVPVSILVTRIGRDIESKASARRLDWLTATFATMIALGILVAASPQFFRMAGLRAFAAGRIPPNVLPLIKPELFFTGFILAAIGVLGRSLIRRRGSLSRPKLVPVASFALLAVIVPLLLLRWAVPLEGYAEARSSRQLAREILTSPERSLPIYGYYYFRTSLPFYLKGPVGLVTSGGSETTSNYIAAQFRVLRQDILGRSLRAEDLDSFSTRASDNGKGKAGSDQDTGDLFHPADSFHQPRRSVDPVLITGTELQALSTSSPTPFVIMARNNLVSDLTRAVGPVQPLWSAWDYSVLQVAAGSKSETQPPVMIDSVRRRSRTR
jgi:4-amino-4-deoxy-L-arabinose transferase-like glycosyltransferase